MISQSNNVRTWVFMGMAMFYVLFLLTVMKFFEASEPQFRPFTTKPVESIVVTDRSSFPELKPVVEREMSYHVVRVSHPLHRPSPSSSQEEQLDPRALLKREFLRDEDDSKINDILDGIRASSSSRLCDGSGSDARTGDRCRRLFPANVWPRLRAPMLKRDGVVIRSLLGLVRAAIGSNKKGRRRTNGVASSYVVSTEWGTSRIR